jgi:hypothetical protein
MCFYNENWLVNGFDAGCWCVKSCPEDILQKPVANVRIFPAVLFLEWLKCQNKIPHRHRQAVFSGYA